MFTDRVISETPRAERQPLLFGATTEKTRDVLERAGVDVGRQCPGSNWPPGVRRPFVGVLAHADVPRGRLMRGAMCFSASAIGFACSTFSRRSRSMMPASRAGASTVGFEAR